MLTTVTPRPMDVDDAYAVWDVLAHTLGVDQCAAKADFVTSHVTGWRDETPVPGLIGWWFHRSRGAAMTAHGPATVERWWVTGPDGVDNDVAAARVNHALAALQARAA